MGAWLGLELGGGAWNELDGTVEECIAAWGWRLATIGPWLPAG